MSAWGTAASGAAGRQPAAGPAPDAPVGVHGPFTPEELDELVRRPPAYSQQNSPLDAPRFTRSARPAPAAGSLPAPDTTAIFPSPVSAPSGETGTTGPAPAPSQTPDVGRHNTPVQAGGDVPGSPGTTSARPPLQAPDMGQDDGARSAGVGGQGLGPSPLRAPDMGQSISHPQAPDMGQHAARSPLQAPDMGQQNAPARSPLQAPDMGQTVGRSPLQAPDMGQQNAPARSPLQAPDMGQHSARSPLQAPDMGQTAPPASRPAGEGPPMDDENTPSGLPSRTGTPPVRPVAPSAPEMLEDPSTAPSGLPPRRPR
ncbi:hypothetical protein [Actinoplanes sp. NPDC049802]|uniref:hypothetical protein n=1 Tax=Actinoplanes sp. NPDC049802 TaxID=3154742 RepID=UPI0033C37BA4